MAARGAGAAAGDAGGRFSAGRHGSGVRVHGQRAAQGTRRRCLDRWPEREVVGTRGRIGGPARARIPCDIPNCAPTASMGSGRIDLRGPYTRRALRTPHARCSALPAPSTASSAQASPRSTPPPRGDFWNLKMSFGPCSKNLAEKMFLEPKCLERGSGDGERNPDLLCVLAKTCGVGSVGHLHPADISVPMARSRPVIPFSGGSGCVRVFIAISFCATLPHIAAPFLPRALALRPRPTWHARP